MYNFVNFITYENGNFLELHRPFSLRINSQNQEIKKIKGDYILFQSIFRSNFALLTMGSDFWPSKILLSNCIFSFLNLCSAPHISELLHVTLMLSFTRQAVYFIPKSKHISDLSQSFCVPQLFLQ